MRQGSGAFRNRHIRIQHKLLFGLHVMTIKVRQHTSTLAQQPHGEKDADAAGSLSRSATAKARFQTACAASLRPLEGEVMCPIRSLRLPKLIVWRTCRQLFKLGHDLGVPLVRQHPVILALTQQNLEHHVGV